MSSSPRRARVKAAYATVRVLDPISGKPTVAGFHEGAVFPVEADPENVAALVRREYAEWLDEDETEAVVKQKTAEDKAAEDAAAWRLEDAEAAIKKDADDAEDSEPDEPNGGKDDDNGGKPKPYASKEAWLAYAVSQRAEGVSEEDATEALADKTKADLIAEFGG
jgi:hypothetical protein